MSCPPGYSGGQFFDMILDKGKGIYYNKIRKYDREVHSMLDNGETIERLARQLEQQKILNELRSCKTIEDFKALTEKYQAICDRHKIAEG